MKTKMEREAVMEYRSDDSLIPGLPVDLTAWINRSELLQVVLDAVQNVPLPEHTAPQFCGYSTRMLLTLETFCYSMGCLSSQEIEKETGRNATARYICAHTQPDWNVLRSFRRVFRQTLTAALAQVFAQIWQKRFFAAAQSDQPLAWLNARYLSAFIQEAQRRLDRALFLDSVALDE